MVCNIVFASLITRPLLLIKKASNVALKGALTTKAERTQKSFPPPVYGAMFG